MCSIFGQENEYMTADNILAIDVKGFPHFI